METCLIGLMERIYGFFKYFQKKKHLKFSTQSINRFPHSHKKDSDFTHKTPFDHTMNSKSHPSLTHLEHADDAEALTLA